MEQRKFIRHPSDIPIVAAYEASDPNTPGPECLRNIGGGGLSFQSGRQLEVGAAVRIAIPLVEPAFEISARVVWCARTNGVFDIGVEFLEPDKVFKVRMVEQVCHIEHYKREVFEKEGRTLTNQEASLEWIAKCAADFPPLSSEGES